MNNNLSFKFQTLFSLSVFCIGMVGIAFWSLSLDSIWKFVIIGIAAIVLFVLFFKIAFMPTSFIFSKKELIISYLFLPKKKWTFNELKSWSVVEIKTFNDVYKIIELYFETGKSSKKVGISKQEYKGFESFEKFMTKSFRNLRVDQNKE